jgi:carbonic anhydrase/acetyltransferase-like protein (isoleucine patch superfamily)
MVCKNRKQRPINNEEETIGGKMNREVYTGKNLYSSGDSVFIADTATVIGDVSLGDHSSVFFGSVLRADINTITVGERSNIQDLCCLHVGDEYPCIVGNDVVVGHNVVLHGCTVEDAVLVGIGAIVLNGAKIGYGSIIGAGTLITRGTVVPPYSLVLGSPGKVVKAITEDEVKNTISMAEKYCRIKDKYLKEMK